MKTFDTDTLALLASGRVAQRDLMLIDLPSGLYGFHTGSGIFPFGGVDYVGSGQLITIEAMQLGMTLAAIPLIARLTSVPNTALTPNVLATIEDEQYHQRPAVISRAYIDPDSRTVISVNRLYRGYIDKIEHHDQIPVSDNSGGTQLGASLTVYLESKARDHQKKGYRTRSDADQRRIDASDGGLKYCAVVGDQQIFWGRLPDQAVAASIPNANFKR